MRTDDRRNHLKIKRFPDLCYALLTNVLITSLSSPSRQALALEASQFQLLAHAAIAARTDAIVVAWIDLKAQMKSVFISKLNQLTACRSSEASAAETLGRANAWQVHANTTIRALYTHTFVRAKLTSVAGVICKKTNYTSLR